MHAVAILTRVLEPCLAKLHAKRKQSLLRATAGLLSGGIASLSAIALRLSGSTTLKHRLKSVDRLLGNGTLHQVRGDIYRRLAQCWLAPLPRILIVVDWSDVTKDQRWQLLRASVVVEGRSITLYEEVHPQSRYGHPDVHRRFLRQLRTILPPGCQPIVMTDAGFHAPWFKMVQAEGWFFIGRLRGRNRVRLKRNGRWIPAHNWYPRAAAGAQDLGIGEYARSNPIPVRVVLARRAKKDRHRLNMYGSKRSGRSSARNSRSAREPWLLVSSPALQYLSPDAIINLYAQRMRIEQSFRDTKNARVGMGLENARSRSGARFEMLLLIAHLASFVQRLIGERAREQQLELQFMATRRKGRKEISVLTLGRRILDMAPDEIDKLFPWDAIPSLTRQAVFACGAFT